MAKSNFGALLKSRSGFMLQVYALLAAQLALTALTIFYLRQKPEILDKITKSALYMIGWFILSILVLIAIIYTKNIYIKTFLFVLFGIILAIIFAKSNKYVSIEVIEKAIAGTVAIFITMSIVGLGLASIGVDLSFLGFILLSILIGVIIASLISIFFLPEAKLFARILVIITLILFSVYVAYDTNIMLLKPITDPVSAATDFYLDIFNILNSLISLLSE